jgi:hypothetical protein
VLEPVDEADLADTYLHVDARVAVVDGSEFPGDETHIYLGPLPFGPIVVLEAEASVIWRAAMIAPDEAGLIRAVAEELDLPEEVIRPGVTDFVEDLVQRGLLQRHGTRETTKA